MFCNHCGVQNPGEATFCHQCGKRQLATTRVQAIETANLNGLPIPETVRGSAPSAFPPASRSLPTEQGTIQTSAPSTEAQTLYMQNSRVYGQPITQGTVVFMLPVSSQTLKQNIGTLISGSGGIVALFAFLFLPYITVTLGPFGTSLNATTIANSQGLIWLEAFLAAGAIAVAALLIFRSNPFGMAMTPLTTQIRRGMYALIGMGALGILGQLIFVLNLNNYTYDGTSIISIGVGYSVGFWLYLLAMIAVTIGGVLALGKIMAVSVVAQQQEQQP